MLKISVDKFKIGQNSMKFKIGQEEFSKALLFVGRSLFTKVNLPILSNILISSSENHLEILSTNLETATKVVASCVGESDGKVTIPGKPLFEFVSQLPEGDIILEKLGEEVLVSTKRYSARFATMPTDDFPAIPKIEAGKSVFVSAADFSKAVLRVAFCAAQDEGRPVLTGVLCDFSKDGFSMVATDGYRLSFVKVGASGKMDTPIKVVMPSKSIVEAAKIIADYGEKMKDSKVELLIADSQNQVNFKIGNCEYTSRLIEGTFPAWQKLIPAEFTSKAKISKEELTKVVKVASIFARDAGSIVKFKLEAQGSKGGSLSVSAANSQVGSNEASCDIDLSGKGGEIAFNFRYILEVLSTIDSEDVEFEMIESLNPGRLTIGGEDNYFHIIMPVRLQS